MAPKLKPKSGKTFTQRIKGQRKSKNVVKAGSKTSQAVKGFLNNAVAHAKQDIGSLTGSNKKTALIKTPSLKKATENAKNDAKRNKLKAKVSERTRLGRGTKAKRIARIKVRGTTYKSKTAVKFQKPKKK